MSLKSLICFFNRWNDISETELALAGLSDEQLADLGIPRGRIKEVARKHASRV